MASSDKPLVSHIYTADPSAHVFEGKLYIYPSHDRETDIQFNDNGDQYDMVDYHVISLSTPGGAATDHGVALKASDVPWVEKQFWAPDAAYNASTQTYHLYFPARDKEGIFRIGVASSSRPEGPFTPEKEPIAGSYSIDPAVFVDDDGAAYIYFGGIWGGQLQCWESGTFDTSLIGAHEARGARPALMARGAKLSPDMLQFADGPRSDVPLAILDPETKEPLGADDHDRRFFEAAWMHKYRGRYYFSYSTGDTHFLAYAIGDSPLGPFTYAGRILEPVQGWTTHHSVAEWEGRWWLFYHDASLSGGVDHLRSVKMKEIFYEEDGRIKPSKP